MAVVTDELKVQKTHYYAVAVTKPDSDDVTDGETLWAGSTLGNTVTTDKSVIANQANFDDVYTRVDATT
ncbi:MAG TPA: hypothetical protein VNJ04_19765 [Gemmatimonadaceae bacterium]|nr:hypothetical protein [Gemmatimonadaceae bacterium]